MSAAGVLGFGLRRLKRWAYTRKGRPPYFIPVYTSETGTSREKAEWGYVTGNVLARGIGRGMFHTRYPQRWPLRIGAPGNATCSNAIWTRCGKSAALALSSTKRGIYIDSKFSLRC